MSAEGAAPEMVVDAAAAGGAGEAAPAPAPVVEEPLNAEEALKRVVRAVSYILLSLVGGNVCCL